MKALSVGLIKGNIDEVDQKVQMTWVQPRVLDVQQVGGVLLKMHKLGVLRTLGRCWWVFFFFSSCVGTVLIYNLN